jgi:serine/threonine protein kinase
MTSDYVGQVIDGFEILEQFARGASSRVHLSRHVATNNYCAAKIVDLAAHSDSTFRNLMREISVFMQVSHPCVCPLLHLTLCNDLLIFFMPFARHRTLLHYISQCGGLSEPEAHRLFLQIYSAIRYVHVQHFLVHCDLKPENILLDANDNAQVTDFGLSDTSYRNVLKAQTGTVGYVAPEVLAGHEYGEECDVWSLGVCLYMMFFGHLPFSPVLDHRMIVEEARHLEISSSVSAAAANLISRMLQPQPGARIPMAGIQAHPWMHGIAPLSITVPRPIVFYKVKSPKDIAKFRRPPLAEADDAIVRDAAVALDCDTDRISAALRAGAVTEVTAAYWVLAHPMEERPLGPKVEKATGRTQKRPERLRQKVPSCAVDFPRRLWFKSKITEPRGGISRSLSSMI